MRLGMMRTIIVQIKEEHAIDWILPTSSKYGSSGTGDNQKR